MRPLRPYEALKGRIGPLRALEKTEKHQKYAQKMHKNC